MNVITLRNRAYRKAGVNSSDYSAANLLEDFNAGYYTLAELLANLGEDYFEEQNTKFNLVARSGLYSLPTDALAFKGLLLAYSGTPVARSAYVIASPYDPSEIREISEEESVPVSNPIYDITNNFFRIKPRPTQNVTNGGIIDYIAMPSALTNTGDTPIIPIAYHEKLAVYGAMQMAFKYEKWNKYDRLKEEWDSTVQELENRLAERELNRPMRFKSPMEAGPIARRREL